MQYFRVFACILYRKPGSKMGYLTKKSDGALHLNFLNPDNSGIISEKEKIVTLGVCLRDHYYIMF